MPRHSPGPTAKSTPSIAFTQPASPRNWTVRLSTLTRACSVMSVLDLQARVEHIAQAVAQQAHPGRRKADRDTGKHHHPPDFDRIVASFRIDVAPARCRRRRSNAEETKRRF